jgi:hypothetical protein
VRPVREGRYMAEETAAAQAGAATPGSTAGGLGLGGLLAWLGVGIPFAIGLFIALQKAAALF